MIGQPQSKIFELRVSTKHLGNFFPANKISKSIPWPLPISISSQEKKTRHSKNFSRIHFRNHETY
ncbi:hypothetical protein BLAT2472_10034 [Burkholderia latens]